MDKPAMRIIGLGGLRGSGKDTCAEILREEFGFRSIAYADPMKRYVCEMVGIPLEDYDEFKRSKLTWNREVSPFPQEISGRDICLQVGMLYRELRPDYFMEQVWTFIREAIVDGAPGVVVTDVRFPDELEQMKCLSAQTIKITRDSEEVSGHESERLAQQNLGWDHVIQNNGTLQALQLELREIIET